MLRSLRGRDVTFKEIDDLSTASCKQRKQQEEKGALRRAVNMQCGGVVECLVWQLFVGPAPFLQGSRDLHLPSTELHQKSTARECTHLNTIQSPVDPP